MCLELPLYQQFTPNSYKIALTPFLFRLRKKSNPPACLPEPVPVILSHLFTNSTHNMAKTPLKTPVKTAKPAKAKATGPSIEQASEEALAKLKSLGLAPDLQAEIEWCLGSYKADSNPSGLYQMTEKAVAVFAAEKEKKTKGVTAKLITDLQKALGAGA